ncbi:spore cortex biosynthesis protein YabQ [Blautia sp.]|nr:spore cortex biosynthesis protein YabQ [uncultured Blautia sp.]
MSTYIHNEIWLFLQSMLGGAGLVICYSLIGVIKRLLLENPAAGGISDILYWLAAGLLVFARIYQINHGILRNFLFLGIAAGAFLTYLTIKPILDKICYIILEIPVRFIKKISKKYIKRLLFWGKRCKILVRQSANQYKNSTRNHLQTRRGRKFGKIGEKAKKKENRV